ncbi:MAG TPA: rhomboid family intramembrane serine protease [Acidimicrobiia bacterium]|nr:rhomboid family intramembrane serine protease [Acidimicrobiia bacterium]
MTSEQPQVCYRHPDRPTGLSCTECGRPICGACSIDASVGQRCPECVRRADGTTEVIRARDVRSGVLAASTPVTSTIIAVTVALAVLRFLSVEAWAGVAEHLALANFAVLLGEWWRMFTVVLVHAGGITHILFNMWALYALGPQIEREVGPVPFLALYLSTASAGSAFAYHLGHVSDVSVGASGAIFGLFGIWMASAVRRRNTMAGRAILNQLGFLLLINAAIPFFIRNVSWQGHLGGLVAGFLLGWVWSGIRGENAVVLRTASAVAVAVVAVVSVLI